MILFVNIMRGLDRLDKNIFRSVFHDDAYCDYGFIKTDPDTFATFCMDALKDHIANHHMIGNSLIEFDDDDENTAYGEIYFNAYHKTIENGVKTDVIIAGRYLDRYERRDGSLEDSISDQKLMIGQGPNQQMILILMIQIVIEEKDKMMLFIKGIK